MRAVLHVLATIVLLPYLLLAVAFVMLEQVIGDGTLGALLKSLLVQLTWLVPWGLLGFLMLVILLAALGLHPASRWLGGLVLCLVAVASIAVVIIKPAAPLDMDGLLFLSPCMLVAAYGAWMVVAEGPLRTRRQATNVRA